MEISGSIYDRAIELNPLAHPHVVARLEDSLMADSEHPGAVRTEEVLERLDYGFPLNGVGTSASPAVSKIVPHVWKLWESRRLLARIAGRALVVSTLVVFLIPVEYKSTTRF